MLRLVNPVGVFAEMSLERLCTGNRRSLHHCCPHSGRVWLRCRGQRGLVHGSNLALHRKSRRATPEPVGGGLLAGGEAGTEDRGISAGEGEAMPTHDGNLTSLTAHIQQHLAAVECAERKGDIKDV
jgi:hypothetical protein